MTTHSSILAWRIPWTEEPGRLQSMGLQRVLRDLVTNTHSPLAGDSCIWLPAGGLLSHKLYFLRLVYVLLLKQRAGELF